MSVGSRRLTAGFALSVVVLLVVAAASLSRGRRSGAAVALVVHTHAVLENIERLKALISSTQAMVRGYVITGQDPFLTSYQPTADSVGLTVEELRALTRDNPTQQAALDTIAPRLRELAGMLDQRMRVRRERGAAAAESLVASNAGERAMRRVQATLGRMDREEQRLLMLREAAAGRHATQAVALLVVGFIVNLVILAAAYRAATREAAERQRAAEALARASSEVVDLYENAPCGYHSLDEDGVYVRVNQTELKWLGRTADEVVGRLSFADLLTPEGRVTFPARFAHFKEVGHVENLRFDMVRKDGSEFPVLINATAVRDGDGRFIMSRSTVTNITDREQTLESLLAAVGEGVAIYAEDGRVMSANDAALRILGVAAGEFTGAPLKGWEIVHEDGTPFDRDEWPSRRALRDGRRSYGVLVGIRRPGSDAQWLSVSATPLRLGDASLPDGALVTFADVTSVRQAAEQVAHMTQQLWQSAKLATMGELAASIAHELNNPLGTVTLSVESLQTELPAADARQRTLDVIAQEVQRMGSLVAGLLEFSRRSARQISTVDLREEIRATLKLVQYHLRNRNVAVELAFAEHVPMLHADRQQLRQLFLNLVTNAADAMPEGGSLRISVRTERDSIVTEVADTGSGIPAHLLDKVMEGFFTTKPEGKGTGLGLPICRRIVEEHGGRLTLASTVGSGTTVRIELPLPRGADAA